MALRLDTRLSRRLLDDEVLAVEQLEDAVQQQVVHSGALDTILLELGLVDEATVAKALSAAWETEPLTAEELEAPDKDAVKRLPRRMAARMGICPIHDIDDQLHVAVAAPLDRDLLDELSELVSAQIVPHVVPEVRLQQAIARAYETSVDERTSSLLSSLDHGRKMPVVETPALHDAPAGDDDLDAAGQDDDALEKAAKKWDLVEALAHLVAQPNREGIARVSAAYGRAFLPFSAVFGVRNGKAVGWARLGHCEGAQFERRPLDIPEGSVVDQVLKSPSPLLGKPPINDGNTALFGWLGRRRPQTAVLVPISVAGRPVAVLYADGGVRKRDVAAFGDLVAFGARVGQAFEALLRQRHRAHSDLFRAEPPAPPAMPEMDDDVPAPPPMLDADDDVPAPPLLNLGTDGEPVEVVALPPSSGADALPPLTHDGDGKSPFAAGYQAPVIARGEDSDEFDDEFDEASVANFRVFDAAPLVAPPAEPHAITTALPPDDDAIDEGVEDDISSDDLSGSDLGVAVTGTPLAFETEPVGGQRRGRPPPIDDSEVPDPDAMPVVFGEVVDTGEHARRAWKAALVDTVQSGKQGGEASADEPVLADIDEDDWDDVVLDAANARQLEQKATREEAAKSAPLERSNSATPTPPLPDDDLDDDDDDDDDDLFEGEGSAEAFVRDLDSLEASVVARAKGGLVELGADALPALRARFPGRLLIDPFAEKHPPDSSAELGPLVEVLEAMAGLGLGAAIPHLESRYPAHRFCATFLFAQTPDQRAVELLRPRLHDQEPRIRKLAASALSHFVAHPGFGVVLAHLRQRLTSPAPEARQRAVWFLGYFRDVGSVPQLIALLEDHSEVSRATRSALRQITLQDHSADVKAWSKWWKRARKRSRIDWLLDGLRSKDRDLRYIASTELSRLSGDSFGYRCDDPKRNREQAARIFVAWWADQRAQMIESARRASA